MKTNRRKFLKISLAGSGVALLAGQEHLYAGLWNFGRKPKPVADLSGLDWKGDAFLRETAMLGFASITAGKTFYEQFKNRPGELKNLLSNLGISKWIFHAGVLPFNVSEMPEQLELLKKYAAFAKPAGATQIVFSSEKRDSYPPGKAKLSKLALALEQVAAMPGCPELLLENSMHSICQTADELEFCISQCTSGKVKMLADLAMLMQSGNDPTEFLLRMKRKASIIRLNDLTRPVKGFAGSNERNYRIEPAGKGNTMDFKKMADALKSIRFHGPVLIGNTSPASADREILNSLKEGIGFLRRERILR